MHNLFLSIFLNVHIPNITFCLESAMIKHEFTLFHQFKKNPSKTFLYNRKSKICALLYPFLYMYYKMVHLSCPIFNNIFSFATNLCNTL